MLLIRHGVAPPMGVRERRVRADVKVEGSARATTKILLEMLPLTPVRVTIETDDQGGALAVRAERHLPLSGDRLAADLYRDARWIWTDIGPCSVGLALASDGSLEWLVANSSLGVGDYFDELLDGGPAWLLEEIERVRRGDGHVPYVSWLAAAKVEIYPQSVWFGPRGPRMALDDFEAALRRLQQAIDAVRAGAQPLSSATC